MMNPSENDFIQDEPTLPSQNENERQGGFQRAAQKASAVANETWEQTKQRATVARDRTQYFVRENPIPTIVGALAIGLAIGWALRHATAEDEEPEIETPLGRLNWNALTLPFLWPFFKSVKENLEDSAETVKDKVSSLRDIDVDRYTKPIRKRWKAWRD